MLKTVLGTQVQAKELLPLRREWEPEAEGGIVLRPCREPDRADTGRRGGVVFL